MTLRDPGPDNEFGNSDDGADIRVFSCARTSSDKAGSSSAMRRTGDSETLTWEVLARRRFSRRWSLLASFAHMWNRDHAGAYLGQPVRANVYPATPNDLINTDARGRHAYRDWSFKAHGTYRRSVGTARHAARRHQSGQPFGRTLSTALNYGTIRVLAEPVEARGASATSRSWTSASRGSSSCPAVGV